MKIGLISLAAGALIASCGKELGSNSSKFLPKASNESPLLVSTFTDSSGTNAEFKYPTDLTIDGAGNLYVADSGNNTIRKITPAGVISTYNTIGMNGPQAITIDSTGNIFVGNGIGNVLKKINAAGEVTDWGSGFSNVLGLATDAAGNVFVADANNGAVKKINTMGIVTSIGMGFTVPNGVATDAAGNIFVSDSGSRSLFKITAGTNTTTTIATDLGDPAGIEVSPDGSTIYLSDATASVVKKIDVLGGITIFAGDGTGGSKDGIASNAQFYNPRGLALTSSGVLFVADIFNHSIRKIQ